MELQRLAGLLRELQDALSGAEMQASSSQSRCAELAEQLEQQQARVQEGEFELQAEQSAHHRAQADLRERLWRAEEQVFIP